MSSPAASATFPMPSKAAQAAFTEEVARYWPFLSSGIVVRLPMLGSAMLDWNGAWGPSVPGVGTWRIGLWKVEVFADMPDEHAELQIPGLLKPYVDLPWRLAGVPLLSLALAIKTAHHAVFGAGNGRVHRLWLRLMWRLRPQEMAHRLLAWREKKRTEDEEHRTVMARYAVREAERKAEEEAAFEAEVERRLAERLAAAGA